MKLAQQFNVDLTQFASDEDARLVSDLLEVFADPMFEDPALTQAELRDMASASPAAARAVIALYRSYRAAKGSADDLSSRIAERDDLSNVSTTAIPSRGGQRSHPAQPEPLSRARERRRRARSRAAR